MSIDGKLPNGSGSDKEGYLYLHQEEKKSLKKFYCLVKNNIFTYGSNPKDANLEESINILGAFVRTLDIRLRKKFGIEILVVPGLTEMREMTENEIISHDNKRRYCFYADTNEDAQEWFSMLYRCSLPSEFTHMPVFMGHPEELSLFVNLPKLKDTPAPQRRALLWRKLRMCGVRFDFSNPAAEPQCELKKQTLLELVEASELVKGLFNDFKSFEDTTRMIAVNIFRSLPLQMPAESSGGDDDEEEAFMDPEWPHLSLVYELLLHLVLSQQVDNSFRKHILDNAFVERLVELFDSRDRRERDYLKTVTHRIYGKLTNRRAAIRKAINNVFYTFLYETKEHQGIAELLEILASIINGFAIPIRPEHKHALEHSLIPLHKAPMFESYNVQLAYCMTLYTAKDSSLSIPIIRGILRYWPNGNSSKEILFLNELEDLFELVKPEEVVEYRPMLFTRIRKCILSNHFQVAERALYLWNTQAFVGISIDNAENRSAVFPVLFDALYINSTSHWNEAVKQMSLHVLGLFSYADPMLYEQLTQELLGTEKQMDPEMTMTINQTGTIRMQDLVSPDMLGQDLMVDEVHMRGPAGGIVIDQWNFEGYIDPAEFIDQENIVQEAAEQEGVDVENLSQGSLEQYEAGMGNTYDQGD